MRYISIVIILIYFLPAQNLEEYYSKLDSGKIEQVRQDINTLVDNYPDNPRVKLLQAIVIKNGERAAEIFEKIVNEYPGTETAERAEVELLKYYYTIGLYQKTRKQAEKFLEKHPDSDLIQEVVVLLFRSLSYSGDSMTVEKYRGDYANKFPEHDSIIKNIDYYSPYIIIESNSSQVNKDNETYYTVQVGVFSNPDNIKKIKNRITQDGYQVYVKEKEKGDKAVQVGKYSTRKEAHKIKTELKTNFKLDSFVKEIK